jgi:glycosyltransferase involved in cell wall biosynthesis
MSTEQQVSPGSSRHSHGVYLFVLSWSPEFVGGVNEVVLSLARELKMQGQYDPLIAVASWAPLPLPATVRGIPVVNIQFHDGYGVSLMATAKCLVHLPSDLIALRRFLRRNNVKVVNPHFPSMGTALFPLLRTFRLFDGKTILSFHGNDIIDLQKLKPADAALFRSALRAADGLVVCSTSLAESLGQIAPDARVTAIHNGADLELFHARRRPPLSGPKRILHVGKFEPKKAQDVLLAAFGLLLDAGLDVELTLIGATGPALPRTRELAARFGSRVRILADIPHEQLPETYSQSDLFVLPSRQEPFGIVLLEAGAAGLPVIATKVGGIPELICHQRTGLLVAPDDSTGLASAMTLASAWQREAMQFTWAGTARGYLDLLGD